jgi:hypothetical protein
VTCRGITTTIHNGAQEHPALPTFIDWRNMILQKIATACLCIIHHEFHQQLVGGFLSG